MNLQRLRKLAGLTILTEDYDDVRRVTNQIHEAMDEGIIEPRAVADAALKYMSEDEVADMAHANEFHFGHYDIDDEDDDGYDPDEDYDTEDDRIDTGHNDHGRDRARLNPHERR